MFAHLHLHTSYSLLDGINSVDAIPAYAKSIGQTAVAITDHGTVAGTNAFYKSCIKNDVKPLLGVEAYYTINDRTVREKDDNGESYYHLVLLAKNNNGLKNLFALTSRAYTEGFYYKPRVDDELLMQYSQDIIATSACLGSRASQLILLNRSADAEAIITHHAQIFKDNFFIELQLHDGEQQIVNSELIKIATKHNLPLILTNDCHYTHPSDKPIHEMALAIQTNTNMSNPKRFTFGDIDVHVSSHDWMDERRKLYNIPYSAISNTQYVADLIGTDYFSDIKNRYPTYKHLPEGYTSWDYLEYLVKESLFNKFQGIPPEVYRTRVTHELSIIKKMGFDNYLLIVAKFVDDARKQDVLIGPGRGSAAGSLVAYALGITQIDPIQYDLLFERWLNYGRAATPMLFDLETKKHLDSLVD